MRRGCALSRAIAACAVIGMGVGTGAGQAQEAGLPEGGAGASAEATTSLAPPRVPLLTLDEDRLFAESAFGKAAQARQDDEARALIEENRRIEAALEVEEKDLTARRPTMKREEFAPLSDAFNVKVEGIRKAQDAKSRELNRRADQDRRAFLLAVRPILAEVMLARGAVAIIDKRAVFVGFEHIDVTAEAIAQLDKAYAEGKLSIAAEAGDATAGDTEAGAAPDPAPETAPETAPDPVPADP